jgi:hypothetical protein
MDKITGFFSWVETRLDEGGWIRRAYLVAATAMTWNFVLWAMKFAEVSPRPGGDVAMVIGAIGVPLSAVTGFAFQNYLTSRKP